MNVIMRPVGRCGCLWGQHGVSKDGYTFKKRQEGKRDILGIEWNWSRACLRSSGQFLVA